MRATLFRSVCSWMDCPCCAQARREQVALALEKRNLQELQVQLGAGSQISRLSARPWQIRDFVGNPLIALTLP